MVAVCPQQPSATRGRKHRLAAQTALDDFVLAQIEASGQQPTTPPDRRTLVRRAYLDLLGLPPTTEQLAVFVRDTRADAWPRLIDEATRLPQYGERWGRHWLDVARYADTNGMDEDIAHPHAHRYRDYVIAAFNKDKPFDQFILNSCRLPPACRQPRPEARPDHRARVPSVGPKMLACDDPDKMRRESSTSRSIPRDGPFSA